MAVTCDVAEEDSLSAAIAVTLERFGRVDSMFVNAGTTGPRSPT
jgi:NAD(P)-dependent dehydrogenase (short-subunit alcohol dehydrogenase family)